MYLKIKFICHSRKVMPDIEMAAFCIGSLYFIYFMISYNIYDEI